MAAIQDKHADASVGNVTGSNAVNVFLGIGVAWTIGNLAYIYMEFRSLILPCPRCCLFILFFRFFHDRFFFVLFMIVFFFLIFWFRLEIHLFTFFPALTFFFYLHFFQRCSLFFYIFSGVDICFCQWKNRKISTFHKLCTIYIHQITWTKQKMKSVFHFSLSLSLVPWIRICCPTWKVSDFLFINCCLYPLFFVQNAEKKWAWVFDIWSKKKKKHMKYWAKFYSIWPKLQIKIFYLIND